MMYVESRWNAIDVANTVRRRYCLRWCACVVYRYRMCTYVDLYRCWCCRCMHARRLYVAHCGWSHHPTPSHLPQVWALSVLLPASRELEGHQLRNQEEGGGREAAEDGGAAQEADRRGLVRALEGEAGLSSGSGSDSGVGNSSVDIPTGLGWRLAAECDENDEGSSGGSAWGAHWRVQQLDRKRERRRVAEQRSSEGAASEQGVAPGRNAAAGVMDGPMGRQPVPLGTAAAPPPAPSSSQHPHPPPPPPPPWFPPFIEAVLTRQLVGLPPRSLIVVANGLSKMELGLTPQQVIGGRGGRLLGDRAATKRASASHRSR